MGKAAETRKYILNCAFDLIYKQGYQATSIDRIIETTDVTKGAFFYHFKNKEEMGLAVIREVVFPRLKDGLIQPMLDHPEPLEGIYQSVKAFMMGVSETQLTNGCPTNNMVQEMAPVNEKFRIALTGVMEHWELAMTKRLEEAVNQEKIAASHELRGVAKFIIGSYEGVRSTGKLFRSYEYYENYLRQLKVYLNSL